jgi:hypothetical protein
VPRGENEMMRKLMNLGYEDIFEAKISQLIPYAHSAKQVRVLVRIRKKDVQ